MEKSSLQALNDLTIASLLTRFQISKVNGEKSLRIPITTNKIPLFKDYIDIHKLSNYVDLKENEKVFEIKSSIMLEQKLKDWTKNGEVVSINPSDLRISTFLLWVSLFTRKDGNYIGLETTLNQSLQETLIWIFKSLIDNCPIASSGSKFHFQSYLQLYLLSVKHHRAYVETAELYWLLSEKEKRRLRQIVTDEEGVAYL